MAQPPYECDRWILGRPPRPRVEPALIFDGESCTTQREGNFILRWEVYEFGLICITVVVDLFHHSVEIPLYYWSSRDPLSPLNPDNNNPYRIDYD